MARDERLAGRRKQEGREDLDQRRLTGAVRAQHPEQLAVPNLDRHLVQRRHGTQVVLAFAGGALAANPPFLLAREDAGEVTGLDGVWNGRRGPLALGPGEGVRGPRRRSATGLG